MNFLFILYLCICSNVVSFVIQENTLFSINLLNSDLDDSPIIVTHHRVEEWLDDTPLIVTPLNVNDNEWLDETPLIVNDGWLDETPLIVTSHDLE